VGDKDVLPQYREQFREECKKDIGEKPVEFLDSKYRDIFEAQNGFNGLYNEDYNEEDDWRTYKLKLDAETFCGKKDDKSDNIVMGSQYRSKASPYMSRKFRNKMEDATTAYKRNERINKAASFDDGFKEGFRMTPSEFWLGIKKSWRNS
jgi:hypothetical protein